MSTAGSSTSTGRAMRFNPISARIGSTSNNRSRSNSSSATPSTSTSSNMIDLTQDNSPPVASTSTANRAPFSARGVRGRLALPRSSTTTSANGQPGPSNLGANRNRTNGEYLEISSDSDSDSGYELGRGRRLDEEDDEVLVIEPAEPGPSRVNTRATRANSHGTAARNRAPAPDTNGDAALARRLAAVERMNSGHSDAARDRIDHGDRAVPEPRNLGGLFGGVFFGAAGAERDNFDYDRMGAGLNYLLGLFPPGLAQHEGYVAAYRRAMGHDNGGYVGVMGQNNGGGWGGQERVRQGKKYAIRMSHPRKVEPGFSREIIEPIDPDNPPPLPPAKSRGKGAKAKNGKVSNGVELEPVCSSCLQPLLLAQSGDQRPFALRCGHCVCGNCISDARARAKMGSWAKDVEYLDASDDDDDDLEYVDADSTSTTTTKTNGRKRKMPACKPTTTGPKSKKGKEKSKSDETGVEDEWTSCPVVGCAGEKTNLLVPEGDYRGPFALFV